jgi:hypothetical protein
MGSRVKNKNFIQAPLRIVHGRIKSSFQGLGMYAVQLDGSRGEVAAYAVGNTRGGLGAMESGVYAVGTRVIVAYISTTSVNTAVILGAGSDAKAVTTQRLPTFSQYPQSAGVEFTENTTSSTRNGKTTYATTVTPRRLNAELYSEYKRLKNYGNGNKDSVDGDWSQVNTFGGGVGVEAFRAWLHGGAMSAVECLFDDTTRVVGKTLEVMTGGAWAYDRVVGQLAERVAGRSYYYADVLTEELDQVNELDGAAFNGSSEYLSSRQLDNLAPATENGDPQKYAPPTLFNEYRGIDGTYVLTSAASIVLQKYVGLPSVTRIPQAGTKVKASQLPGADGTATAGDNTVDSTFNDITQVSARNVGSAATRASAVNTVGSFIVKLIYKNETDSEGKVVGLSNRKAHPIAAILDQAGLCLSEAKQGWAAIAESPEYSVVTENIATVTDVSKALDSGFNYGGALANAGDDLSYKLDRTIAYFANKRPVKGINYVVSSKYEYYTLDSAGKAVQVFRINVLINYSLNESDSAYAKRLEAWEKDRKAQTTRRPLLNLVRDPSMWRTAPQSFSLNVGPYGQSKRFFFGHAFITINEQGDIILQNASGSQLMLAGSNIVMSSEHDVITTAGRNIVTMAGRDSAHRAARHYEVATNEGRVGIRAQGQLSMGGGFDGTSGVVVESGSTAQTSTAQAGGSAHSSPGLMLISKSAPIALATNVLYGSITETAFISAPSFTHYSPGPGVYTEIGNGLWMHDSQQSIFIQPFSAYFTNVHVIDTLAGKTFKKIKTSDNAEALLDGAPIHLTKHIESIKAALAIDSAKASFLSSEEYGVNSAASFQIPMPAWYKYYWNQSSREALANVDLTSQTLLPKWYTPGTGSDSPMPGTAALAYIMATTATDTGAYKADSASTASSYDDAFMNHALTFERHINLGFNMFGKGI